MTGAAALCTVFGERFPAPGARVGIGEPGRGPAESPMEHLKRHRAALGAVAAAYSAKMDTPVI